MTKQLFDCFPPEQASTMRMVYLDKTMTWLGGYGDEIPGGRILTHVQDIAQHVAARFGVDVNVCVREILDLLDATIWADLSGGMNDPINGKDNPYWENVKHGRDD